MRATTALLILLLAAAPASAQQGLRGRLEPSREEPRPAVPAASPLPGPAGQDAQRCRTNCAGGYYVCLSTESAEDCAPSWLQCRNACDAAGRRQVISSLPSRP